MRQLCKKFARKFFCYVRLNLKGVAKLFSLVWAAIAFCCHLCKNFSSNFFHFKIVSKSHCVLKFAPCLGLPSSNRLSAMTMWTIPFRTEFESRPTVFSETTSGPFTVILCFVDLIWTPHKLSAWRLKNLLFVNCINFSRIIESCQVWLSQEMQQHHDLVTRSCK